MTRFNIGRTIPDTAILDETATVLEINEDQLNWNPGPPPSEIRGIFEVFAWNWTHDIGHTRTRIIRRGICAGGWKIEPQED